MADVSDVKQWLRREGRKQGWLADQIGCNEKHLSLVLNGKKPVTGMMRAAIARVTGINVTD